MHAMNAHCIWLACSSLQQTHTRMHQRRPYHGTTCVIHLILWRIWKLMKSCNKYAPAAVARDGVRQALARTSSPACTCSMLDCIFFPARGRIGHSEYSCMSAMPSCLLPEHDLIIICSYSQEKMNKTLAFCRNAQVNFCSRIIPSDQSRKKAQHTLM